LKLKYIILTTLLAAFIIPAGYVTADTYFTITQSDSEVDGTNSFSGLNGATFVSTFKNTTTAGVVTHYAVVGGFIDHQISLIDVTTPTDIRAIDHVGDDTRDVDPPLAGPKNIALFINHTGQVASTSQHVGDCTGTRCEVIGIVTEYNADTISAWNFSNPATEVNFLSNHTSWIGGSKVNNVLAYDHGGIAAKAPRVAGEGPTDVAIFWNASMGVNFAAVTNYDTDGVTFYNLEDLSDMVATSNVTDGKQGVDADINRPDLELNGASGIDTFYIAQSGGGHELPYAIVTATLDDGFQIFDLDDPIHTFAVDTSSGYLVRSGGVGVPSAHANGTDGDDGFELLDGLIDVSVWNVTNNNKYAIMVAQADSSFVILDVTDPTAKMFEKQVYNHSSAGAGANGSWWNVTSPSKVETFIVDGRAYAAISSNGTTGTTPGMISIIDLYEPSSPKPVTNLVYDDMPNDASATHFDNLGGVEGMAIFTTGSETYLAATAYEDDALTILKLTGDRPSSGGSSKICGFNYDCEPPSVTEIQVGNTNLDTSKRYNDVDTTQAKVGQLVTVKATISEDFAITKVNLYFDIQGDPSWNNADAAIKYTMNGDSTQVIDDNNIFDADVDLAQLDDNLTEISFKIMFTGEMDASHIAIQSIDDSANYQILYFKDALEVTGTPTQTSTDETLDDEITQTTATVPGWVKNTAGWWADGAISEGEFVKGIQFLIEQQIIGTDAQTSSTDGTGAAIPDWVKNTAGWWADGAISEGEFVNAIEHLVKTGTIIVI
jgi:hypothetical protein